MTSMYDGRSGQQVLVDLIGDTRFVILGEASHGAHELYEERADITRRLIWEKGFNAVRSRPTGPTPTG
jgi:erythromycin esterase-like protein